ncbi:MAG: DUF167 domain-containing protein [Chloroflexi bacterium]|nr:DUF167 domain-containing protein [Chloroflexota bacterium]
MAVALHPRSKGNQIVGFRDGVLHVRVTAPPVGGKANEALLSFLALVMGIKEGEVGLMGGERQRNKVVAIYGMSLQEVTTRLERVAIVRQRRPPG